MRYYLKHDELQDINNIHTFMLIVNPDPAKHFVSVSSAAICSPPPLFFLSRPYLSNVFDLIITYHLWACLPFCSCHFRPTISIDDFLHEDKERRGSGFRRKLHLSVYPWCIPGLRFIVSSSSSGPKMLRPAARDQNDDLPIIPWHRGLGEYSYM